MLCFVGDLKFLGDVTTLLGAPLIPCLFLVLGANLAEGPGAAQVIVVMLKRCRSRRGSSTRADQEEVLHAYAHFGNARTS